MRFTEAQAGDNLIIQIVFEDQTIDLPSKIIGIKTDSLLVGMVHFKGKILNLSSNRVRINVMLIRENKIPIIWKNVACKIVAENGKQVYQITAYSEGYENNRRDAFRLFIGNGGVAQLGINKKALDVVVKDVSENGFSFLSSNDIDMVIGKPVRLVFADLDTTFSLMGIVVRKVKMNEKEILYGCKLSVKNNKLLKYISSKQRLNISESKKYTRAEELQAAVLPQNVDASKDTDASKTDNFSKDDGFAKIDALLNESVKTKNKGAVNVNRYETTTEVKKLFEKAYNQDNSSNMKKINKSKEVEKHISSLNREQRRAAYKNSHVGKKV